MLYEEHTLFLNGTFSPVVEFLRRYGDTCCLHLQDKKTKPTKQPAGSRCLEQISVHLSEILSEAL